jgi:polysaccharide biosynthesis/export protein
MKLLLTLTVALAAFGQAVPLRAPAVASADGGLPVQKIGRDDLIGISVYDAPELTRTARVAADGTIRLPMLKQRIAVAGLLPNDVEAALAAALMKEEIMVDPIVTVSIMEYRSRPISVGGAVKQPTTFQATEPLTLLDAISRAGGLTEMAGAEILVTRQPVLRPDGSHSATLIQRVPVTQLIDAADPEVNLRLEGGEEVRVPEAGRVYVVGNVKKPGAYLIKDGAETSLLKALAMSEGLLPYAAKQAFIYRREAGAAGKNEIPVELKSIIDRKSPDVALFANDVIYIPDNKGRRDLMTVLERSTMIGAGISAALIYALTR